MKNVRKIKIIKWNACQTKHNNSFIVRFTVSRFDLQTDDDL